VHPSARLITLLLAVCVGLSYGAPCLQVADGPRKGHAHADAGDAGHVHAAPSADGGASSPAHAGHSTARAGLERGAAPDCGANLFAPCPCGCGQGSGPAGVSARPGPAVRTALAALPAAGEMRFASAEAPLLSPAPRLGVDHVPI